MLPHLDELGITPETNVRIEQVLDAADRAMGRDGTPLTEENIAERAAVGMEKSFGFGETDAERVVTLQFTVGQLKTLQTGVVAELSTLLDSALSVVLMRKLAGRETSDWTDGGMAKYTPEALCAHLCTVHEILGRAIADSDAQDVDFTIPETLEGLEGTA